MKKVYFLTMAILLLCFVMSVETVDASLTNITLPLVSGGLEGLLQDTEMTLVYVTNPDCIYCQSFEESVLPVLQELIDDYGNTDLVIVNFGDEGKIRDKYASSSLKVFFGTQEFKDKVDLKGVPGVPSFFLVSKDGEILGNKVGFQPGAGIEALELLQSIIEQQTSTAESETLGESGIEIVSGSLSPSDLEFGEYALFFFLSENCPACEIVDQWFDESISTALDLDVIFVTTGKTRALEEWMNKDAPRNVWVDEDRVLSSRFGVHKVPSVYLVRDGQIVTMDEWPFYGELEGLESLLRYFVAGGFKSRGIPNYVGQTLPHVEFSTVKNENINTSALELPALMFFYSPFCESSIEALSILEGVLGNGEFSFLTLYVVYAQGTNDYVTLNIPGVKTKIIDGLQLIEELDIGITPFQLLIDSNGKIVWQAIGHSETLESALHEALSSLQ